MKSHYFMFSRFKRCYDEYIVNYRNTAKGDMMFKRMIYYFVSVVDEGSFSAAGKKYYLSQSAISQQITKLESELGFVLFDRQGYRPLLTEEGKSYYQLCKTMIHYYESEIIKIEAMNTSHRPQITVGITGPFEKKHVPLIIRDFKKNYEVSFNVKVIDLCECIEELKNRTIDIGFGLVNDFRFHKEFHYHNIYTSHICVVTSLNHALSQRKTISIEEVKDEPIIVLSKKSGIHYYEDFMQSFALDRISPHIIKEVDNLNEFIMAIQLDQGIGFSALEVISSSDGVKAIPLENSHHHAHYAVGYHCENEKKLVKDFYDYIVRYFQDYKKNL